MENFMEEQQGDDPVPSPTSFPINSSSSSSSSSRSSPCFGDSFPSSSQWSSTTTSKNSTWKPRGSFVDGTHYVYHHIPKTDGGPSTAEDVTVVFINGMGSTHDAFDLLASVIRSKGYSTLQYDLLGRGFSEPSPNGHYGRDEHIAQLHNLLSHIQLLKQKHLHIIGHSMGGCLAVLFAEQHREYVKSLVLVAPAGLLGYFPIEFLKSMCPTCFHSIVKRIIGSETMNRKAWNDDFYSHEGKSLKILNARIEEMIQVFDNSPGTFEAYWSSMFEFPLTNISEDIIKVARYQDLPIMLVWGKQDKACPISNLKEWEKLILGQRNSVSKTFGEEDDGLIDSGRLYFKVYDKAAHGIINEHYDKLGYEILMFFHRYSIL